METDDLIHKISTEIDVIIGDRRSWQILVPATAIVGIAIGIYLFPIIDNPMLAIGVMALGVWLAYLLFRQFNRLATRRLMPMLAKMAGNWSYTAEPHRVPTEQLSSYGVLPDADKTEDSHLIAGEIGGLPFRYWNTHLEDRGSKSSTTRFRGAILEMPAIEAREFVLVRPAKSALMRALSDAFSLGNTRFHRLERQIPGEYDKSYAVFVGSLKHGQEAYDWVEPRIAKCNRILPTGARIHGVLHTSSALFVIIDRMKAPYMASGLYARKENLLHDVEDIVRSMSRPIKLLEIWQREDRDPAKSTDPTLARGE